MPELYARVGDPDLDDALALMEQADSAIDRAAGHFEEAGRAAVVGALEDALECLREADELLR